MNTTKTKTRRFCVAAISIDTNSFGLAGHVLIANDGEAWEVGRHLCGTGREAWVQGSFVDLTCDDEGRPFWHLHGVEIPRKLPNAPGPVVREVWDAAA